MSKSISEKWLIYQLQVFMLIIARAVGTDYTVASQDHAMCFRLEVEFSTIRMF